MPIIKLYINGVPLYFVVDSGAAYSTLNKSELEHLEYENLKEKDGGTYGIDGNIIPVNNNKFIMPSSDVHIIITYKPIEETKGEDTTNPITGDMIKAYARILISSLIGTLLVVINKQLLIDEM